MRVVLQTPHLDTNLQSQQGITVRYIVHLETATLNQFKVVRKVWCQIIPLLLPDRILNLDPVIPLLNMGKTVCLVDLMTSRQHQAPMSLQDHRELPSQLLALRAIVVDLDKTVFLVDRLIINHR